MSSLIPRTPGPLAASSQVPDGFSRNEGKQLARLQNAEVTRGLVAATRVQTRGFVAAIGIQTVGMLSREAAFQGDGDPLTANRLNYIVDQYATFVGGEIARFGH